MGAGGEGLERDGLEYGSKEERVGAWVEGVAVPGGEA